MVGVAEGVKVCVLVEVAVEVLVAVFVAVGVFVEVAVDVGVLRRGGCAGRRRREGNCGCFCSSRCIGWSAGWKRQAPSGSTKVNAIVCRVFILHFDCGITHEVSKIKCAASSQGKG